MISVKKAAKDTKRFGTHLSKVHFMTYKDFADSFTDPNRKFSYYYALAGVPEALKPDMHPPHFLDEVLENGMAAFW